MGETRGNRGREGEKDSREGAERGGEETEKEIERGEFSRD